jgi:hypothetical protein
MRLTARPLALHLSRSCPFPPFPKKQTQTHPHERTLAMTSGEGVPSRSVMSSSWCTTLRPGKSGLPSRISAKMQPMDLEGGRAAARQGLESARQGSVPGFGAALRRGCAPQHGGCAAPRPFLAPTHPHAGTHACAAPLPAPLPVHPPDVDGG